MHQGFGGAAATFLCVVSLDDNPMKSHGSTGSVEGLGSLCGMREICWTRDATYPAVSEPRQMCHDMEHGGVLISYDGCMTGCCWLGAQENAVQTQIADERETRIFASEEVDEDHAVNTTTITPPTISIQFAGDVRDDLEDQGPLMRGQHILDAPHELCVELLYA